MRSVPAVLAVVGALLAGGVALAQSGGISVKVVDANGPLPGATVTISHETGYVKTTSMLTNKDGMADFPVLKPGQGYTIEVSFPGFGVRRLPGLQVKIGETTTQLVQLTEELSEHVKVIAKTENVKLEETSQSTKFSDEFIQDLPVAGRFYQNVLTLAPGVQDSDGDGNPNVHGSRDRDFKAVVGGISNVDPLTGQQMAQINPNSIEEIEVITAGAGVQFSRAQGGYAQILQKQGTNEFEGVVDLIWRSSRIDGDGAADNSNLPDPEFDWVQPGFQISGPVIKDKLWYVFSHELIDIELPVNTTSGIVVETQKQSINSDRLTWQMSPRNKLSLQYQSDPLEIENFGVTSLTPPESSQRRETNAETFTLNWTTPVSPKILVDSSLAWQDLNSEIGPTAAGLQNNCLVGGSSFDSLLGAQCRVAETGQVSGSFPFTVDAHSQRLTVRSDATVFGGNFWGMSHTFELGMIVENERFFRHLERRPNMTVFIIDPAQDAEDNTGEEDPDRLVIMSTRFAVPSVSDVRATGTNWGIYAEDQVRVTNNLSFTVGLRIDREEIHSNGQSPFDPEGELANYLGLLQAGVGSDLALQRSFTAYEALGNFTSELASQLGNAFPESLIRSYFSYTAQQSEFWNQTRRVDNIDLTNTNLTPFLSVSWDPWGNGKTRFAATARRYYDKVFLSIPLIELEPATADLVLNAEETTQGFVPTGLRSSINPSVNVSTVSRNLVTPYNDEYTLSVEREVLPETTVRLTYVNRRYRDQLQDIDLNHVPGDYGRCRVASVINPDPIEDPPDGILDDCAGEIVLPEGQVTNDPLSPEIRVERPDGVLDLYTQNPGWGDLYLVGNYNNIDYEGVTFELTRRQYRGWELTGSYTWSEAKGDGEDFNQALGDDRTLIEDEKGYQSYDQRHVVKVTATTITRWGVRLGGNLSWESGLPYSVVLIQPSFNSAAPALQGIGANTLNQRWTYVDGVRNSQRNKSYWNLDLKVTKEFNLPRGVNMQVSAEVFNTLNDGTLQIYDPILETGLQVNGNNTARRRFGRRWQMALKLAF